MAMPARSFVVLLAVFVTAMNAGVRLSGPPAVLAASSAPGPQSSEADPGRRQLWLIPSPEPGVMMRATLFRPPGEGPFPLAVINHGSEEDPYLRAKQAMPEFRGLTDWFLGHGYAVLLPQRPGHGATGGRYLESQGDCRSADYHAAGMGGARSIAAAVDFMTAQPFIAPARVVVVGNSGGGWGALALASDSPGNVAAVINFAGGRGGHDQGQAGRNCAPDRLVAAAAAFGKTARIPTLWLYAENDSYFPPDLSARLAEAFRAAGGKVEYHLLPPVGREGHALAQSPGAAASWGPVLEGFLRRLHLLGQKKP